MKHNLSSQEHTPNEQSPESVDSHPSQSSNTSFEEDFYPQAETIPNDDIALLDLQEALEQAEAEVAIANDKCLRIHAEFDNFRKRTVQERISLIETAGQTLLEEFLPIVDDFERALHAFDEEKYSLDAVATGIKLIHDKMIQFLVQAHVYPMPIEAGTTFNPDFHEAISKTAVSNKALQNKIIDVVTKGYMLKDKVLRYAQVIIGE
jgi:molecular chaperone GrpE